MEGYDSHRLSRRVAYQAAADPHLQSLFDAALLISPDTTEAGRLTSQVYSTAYQSWNNSCVGNNCRRWLFGILADVWKNASQPVAAPAVGTAVDAKAPGSSLEPANDFGRIVRQAIRLLPDELRLILILSFIEGFSYREVAEIVKLDLPEVKARLARARQALRRMLPETVLDAVAGGKTSVGY
jgi:RNA polymerase sigma-70 factor (ECF subfamily)